MWKVSKVYFQSSLGITIEGFNLYSEIEAPFRWSYGYLGENALRGSSWMVPAEGVEIHAHHLVLAFLRRAIDRGEDAFAKMNASKLMLMAFTEDHVGEWMKANKHSFIDDHDELMITQLVEAAAEFFDHNGEGGPLDDPDHWIWFLPALIE